jgi:putative membrane protein
MKLVRRAVLTATAVLAAGLSVQAAPTAADRRFMADAAAGGLAEVELGRLATDKGTRSEVKDFGKMMVDDHSKANEELKSLAEKEKVTLPAALKPADKALEARLRKLSGAAFDDAYMRAMVNDHVKDVAAFERESKSGGDADLKEWAGKTLPTLKHHLEKAKEAAPKH